MSAWRKAAKSNQKVHRERHQPEARKHLGLLEKKKDYKVRAINVQRKEKALQILHRRALDRNPDEFYHHMINAKVNDGVHHEEQAPDEHTKEQLALMQTQDLKYVAMKRTIEAKKIKRLQAQLHMIDTANTVTNKHILFVDNDEKDIKDLDFAKRLETDPSLLGNKVNRRRLEDSKKQISPELTPEERKKAESLRKSSYQELEKRIQREKELSIVQRKIEMERRLKQNRLLKPKRIRKGTKNAPPVYQFCYERKK